MQLKDYRIDGEYICINRKELEELRDRYDKINHQTHRQPATFLKGYYNGKKDVIIDILNMFESLTEK